MAAQPPLRILQRLFESISNQPKNRKNTNIFEKVAKKFGGYIKTPYLCTRF